MINLADGSFVETSSAMAARELKKRYDMHFGVSIEARSPFALTSFVNQHGKQMIRLGCVVFPIVSAVTQFIYVVIVNYPLLSPLHRKWRKE